MKSVPEMIRHIETLQDCLVYSSQGFPKIIDNALPEDLVTFYRYCGGISLFRSSPYSIEIVPPSRFLLANSVIMGISENDLLSKKDDNLDISWFWYIIGEGENAQYISIDLASERLGNCYDSYWDLHATAGYTPVIATSFTELLERLVQNQGNHWYWLQPEFQSYGDAYGNKE